MIRMIRMIRLAARGEQDDPEVGAVEFYLNARREEMEAGMRDLLSQLDGSRAAERAIGTLHPSLVKN
jgi:hypothetical protein